MDEECKKLLRSLGWATAVLKRYFEGKLNKHEKEIVEEHLKSIDEQSDTEEILPEKQLDESDERIRRQVFLRLNLKDPEKEERKPSFISVKLLRFAFIPLFKKYAGIAAVFIAVIATSYFVLNESHFGKKEQVASLQNKMMLVQTGESEMKKLTLPDGTILYVNAGSRIDYIKNQFNKEKREMWLVGEAFFDVAKNPKKPFIIHTGNIQTVVRGTSFNIKAYGELNENVVSVRTGRVEVKAADKVLDVLTANKQIVYNRRDGSFKSTELQSNEASEWMNGNLTLNHADGKELKLRIRQFYGMDLEVKNDAMKNIVLQASFVKGTSLTQVMESLKLIYGIKYKIDNQNKQVLVYSNNKHSGNKS